MESNDNTGNSANVSAPVSDTNTSSNPEVPEWPISPTFLSLRKGKTEEDTNYISDGIFYTDYLRGFLADLSHDKNVKNALSLFQFVPEDFLPHDPNAVDNNIITTDPNKATVILNAPLEQKIEESLKKQQRKIIRIDSGTFINNGKLCDAFRRCGENNTSFCFKQDSIVGIFADEELNEYDNNSSEYQERLEKLISEYNQERDEKNSIKLDEVETKEEKRIYIHYTCPISLYEEHTFPIYIHGKIIACLMLGQMARENFDIKKAFSGYRGIMKHKSGDIIDFDNINITSCVERDKWDKKARAIVERIIIFEKRIEGRIEHRNNRYVNDAFKKIEKTFRNNVKNINIREESVFTQFTTALNRAFSAIREKFDKSEDGFIRMFALPISIGHDELVPIAWSGAEFETKNEARFAIERLKGIEYTIEIKETRSRIYEQRKIILKAASQDIKERFDEKRDFFLPGWLAGNEVAYIVWKRHNKRLRKKTNKKNFNIYRNALNNFYSIALECYSYIRGARMELLLGTTIQESAHESAHFILPAIDVVENHLEAIPKDMVSPKPSEKYDIYKKLLEKYETELLESFSQVRGSSSFSNYFSMYLQNSSSLHKLKKLLKKWIWDSHDIIYRGMLNKYNTYYFETYEKYRDEVLESLNQLREINYGSSLILSSDLKINKSTVDFSDLLIKLKKTLNDRALDSHKNIYYNISKSHVTANIDAKYLNHALYNLLDNAIKYGYDGSYIRIKMDIGRENNTLKIEIVSYGIEIETGNRLYKLFERSETAEKIAGGTGIGLYIVKKICVAHGGTIEHRSELLSNYNIPALFNYKYKNTLANKNTLGEIEGFEKDLSRLSGSIENEVVYDTRFISYAYVFSTSIKMPTYRNTFCITIPLK